MERPMSWGYSQPALLFLGLTRDPRKKRDFYKAQCQKPALHKRAGFALSKRLEPCVQKNYISSEGSLENRGPNEFWGATRVGSAVTR
jgi:hypothetical protein